MARTILLTGAAGFIGYHTAQALLDAGDTVVGVDNLNAYYDPVLKQARLDRLNRNPGFVDMRADVADTATILALFETHKPDHVVHLAAQAGVRHSLTAPQDYIDSNVTGFLSILEACRHNPVTHFVYASTSSVYGLNTALPFSEHHSTAHPASLYAASKKANELMAHSYSHLFSIPATGLRFFTVYGPWGRPDMALFLFTDAILSGRPIKVFNNGEMLRDFTYVDDVARSIAALLDKPPVKSAQWDPLNPDPAGSPDAPYRVFNIGNSRQIRLMDYITALENKLGLEAQKEFLPMQPGDIQSTLADVSELSGLVGFRPETTIEDGISAFVDWYRDYYER